MEITSPNRWVRHSGAGLARTVLATLVGLLVWTVLPAALGWQPTVVLSGSMEPAIQTGDVVVTRELPTDQLEPGYVLLVDDPSRPGDLLMHRYDHLDDDGELVLQGDANEQADSTPVSPDKVEGVGVLRVPWVGTPYVWATEGRWLPVGLTALGLVALVTLSPIRERPIREQDDASNGTSGRDNDQHEGEDEGDDGRVESAKPGASSQLITVTGAALLLVVGGVAAGLTTPASAAFTDTVTIPASFTTGRW